MKTSLFRLVTALSVGIMPLLAATDEAADIRAIQVASNKLAKAIAAKNAKACMALSTSDFVWINAHGDRMERAAFEAMIAGQFKMPGLKFHQVSMKNDSFGFMGKECRVRCTSKMAMSAMMGKQRASMKTVTESVDTWRRTPQGWKMCKVEVTYESEQYGN